MAQGCNIVVEHVLTQSQDLPEDKTAHRIICRNPKAVSLALVPVSAVIDVTYTCISNASEKCQYLSSANASKSQWSGSAFSTGGNKNVGNLLDDKLSSFYKSDGKKRHLEWIQIDLGGEYSINKIMVIGTKMTTFVIFLFCPADLQGVT